MSYVGPHSLVTPGGVKANSAEVFAVLDPDSGGAKTFSVPLYVDGQDPAVATYWGCRTLLESATYDALTLMNTTDFKFYVDSLSVQRERNFVSGVNFKNSLEIGPADFWTFIASLGLKRVVTEV